jgi:hypothetical protein
MCKRSLCCNVSADTVPVVVQRSDPSSSAQPFGCMETNFWREHPQALPSSDELPLLGGSYRLPHWSTNFERAQPIVIALQTALRREYNKSQR